VVNHAIELAKQHDYLDQVICVFDRDDHVSFDQAIQKLKAQQAKRKKPVYVAATSVPCFELWLLLHFKYTTKQYSRTQNKSACDNLITELKQHFPSYTKNMPDLFALLEQHLPTALQNAAKLKQECTRLNIENPSTSIGETVQYLINLR
jgi:hypothetical protein